MARATRSSTTLEKDKPSSSPPATRKGHSKKRKRTSNADHDDALPAKHPRTDTNQDESGEDKEQDDLPSSGDVPIHSSDAADILHVLESVDTQGLLDRVFPLLTDPSEAASEPSSSTSSTAMLSLRSLLKNPAAYPLKLLRAAVQHLHPISSHPRFRPSETAAQQLRFCVLATCLLDQASRNNAPVPLDAETIITDVQAQGNATSPTSAHAPSSGVRPHKYALVQHLPTGDWWTSASSDVPTADGTGGGLKSLPTANAELVSIFPTPSGTKLTTKGTLGDYVVKRAPGIPPHKSPQPRQVSCGKFLDYGPYASFAPSFDQDGVEIGRVAMGEVIFHQQMKRRLRDLVKGKRRAFLAQESRMDVVMEDVSSSDDQTVAGPSITDDGLSNDLESLLSPEEVQNIKSTLSSLEMEEAVDQLLQRNARALQRLGKLQLERLRSQGGGSSVVEVGSEEWDTAQSITDSLVILASLRPRPSNGDPDHAPLIPPASVLHKLQRTLPLAATEEWHGTLPEGRTTAFHDDTTVLVRAAPSKTTPAPTPATPAPKASAAAATTSYTPYAYTGAYQSQFRGYGTYSTPTQNNSYYPSLPYSALAPQTTTGSHYPNAQYTPTAQTQYYNSWYTNSGRSTPQPAPASPATGYASYYAGTAAQQQPQAQRAVANTVMSSAKQPAPTYQPPSWTGATAVAAGYAPPLLQHVRAAVSSTPGTPTPTTPAVASQYGAYFGGYTAPK